MTNAQLSHLDITAIEFRARQLRAEAARDMISVVSKWVRRQFTFGATSTSQSAAI
ncbi:hypothetical protein [Pacificibacter sp. AS14]|uniref:RSP_7527 family protein n=1 Tax=Pacificibacter sp. AS14 TaxID=3135785 RepID=UPI00317DE491